jgi:hypothetical protein
MLKYSNETLEMKKKDKMFDGKIIEEYDTSQVLFDNNGPIEGPGPYFPLWQSAPVVLNTPPYNEDGRVHESLAEALPQLFPNHQHEAVITEVINYADPGNIEMTESYTEWVKNFIITDEDPSEPFSFMYYPIIDDTENIVGLMSMTLFWRDYLSNILPP